MPNESAFPFTGINVSCVDGMNFNLAEGDELRRALQYSSTDGIQELNQWLVSHMQTEHKPPKIHAQREIMVWLLHFCHSLYQYASSGNHWKSRCARESY
jgi:hypothetical protein